MLEPTVSAYGKNLTWGLHIFKSKLNIVERVCKMRFFLPGQDE